MGHVLCVGFPNTAGWRTLWVAHLRAYVGTAGERGTQPFPSLQTRRFLEKVSARLGLTRGKRPSFPSPQSGPLSCADPAWHTLYTSSHMAEKHYSLGCSEDYPTTECTEPS